MILFEISMFTQNFVETDNESFKQSKIGDKKTYNHCAVQFQNKDLHPVSNHLSVLIAL